MAKHKDTTGLLGQSKNLDFNDVDNTPKQSRVAEIYTDIRTFKLKPILETFFDRLAEELIEWAANDEKAFRFTQFLRLKGIPSSTYYDWLTRYPKLKLAHQAAREALADRREVGAIVGKYAVASVMPQMVLYDDDWWKLEQKRAKLKADAAAEAKLKLQEADEKKINYTVIVDKYSYDKGEGEKGSENEQSHDLRDSEKTRGTVTKD